MNTYANPIINLTTGTPAPDVGQVFQSLRAEAQAEIQRRLSPEEQVSVRMGGQAGERARAVIREVVERRYRLALSNPALGAWPEESNEDLAARLYRLFYGLGPVEVLLADPDIEDIAINGPGEIYVRTTSGWSEIPLESVSDLAGDREGLLFMFNQAIAASGRQAGPLTPIVDERLPGGHRLNIITEPVAADGVAPLVVIRRHREAAFTPLEFVAQPVPTRVPRPPEVLDLTDAWQPGSLLTPSALAFLHMAVLAGLNILLLGRTGVGKTAFLSMLGGLIPPERRVLVLEDTRELKLRSGDKPANCVYLTSVPERLEGGLTVPMSQLVIAALRQRPDHLVLGEARGPEMWDLLNAMQTGHGGNLTSVHAISAPQLVERIQFMVSLPPVGVRLSPYEAGKLAATSFHVAITYKMDWSGRRYIDEIAAYTGQMDGDVPEMETLFAGGPENGFLLTPMVHSPKIEEHLRRSGLSYQAVLEIAGSEQEALATREETL
jgi:pilus assembly protein CpaF